MLFENINEVEAGAWIWMPDKCANVPAERVPPSSLGPVVAALEACPIIAAPYYLTNNKF